MIYSFIRTLLLFEMMGFSLAQNQSYNFHLQVRNE